MILLKLVITKLVLNENVKFVLIFFKFIRPPDIPIGVCLQKNFEKIGTLLVKKLQLTTVV